MSECECIRHPHNFQDLTGQVFGRLTVMSFDHCSAASKSMWKCLCVCGRTVIVDTSRLRGRVTQSCGCLQRERARKYATRHGRSKTAEYRCWTSMIERCYQENRSDYCRYGGRGIVVCAKWRNSFSEFYDDMGPRPGPGYSIDRIDNDGNYEPSNCRWATLKQQARNKRTSLLVSFRGKTKTLAEWSEILNVPYGTLWNRVQSGNPLR